MGIGKNALNFFKTAGKAIVAPIAVGAALLAMPFTSNAQKKKNHKDEYGYDKRDYKFFLGVGQSSSNSKYKNGTFLIAGGQAPINKKGTISVIGEYNTYLQDPNKISYGIGWRQLNRRGNTVSSTFTGFTYIPSRASVKLAVGSPSKAGVRVNGYIGMEDYFGSQYVFAERASFVAGGSVEASIGGKNSVVKGTGFLRADYTAFNQNYFNPQRTDETNAVAVAAGFRLDFFPGNRGNSKRAMRPAY